MMRPRRPSASAASRAGRWASLGLGLLSGLLALGGCSLAFRLDPKLLEDGGRDGGLDGGVDGGPDGGFDGGRCLVTTELSCDNGDDDDCDGLIDCYDLDCASDLSHCCGGPTTILNERWRTAVPTGWQPLPVDARPLFEATELLGQGYLSSFGGGGIPRALRQQTCVPASKGVTLTSTLRLAPPETPPGCTGCREYVALVLTSAGDIAEGRGLLDELAVRLYADGDLVVTQAGFPLHPAARWELPTGQPSVDVSITLIPGVDPETGTAVIHADLVLSSGATVFDTQVIARYPFILADDLLGPSDGCTDGDGLFVAVEGVGRGAWGGFVNVTRHECSNPGVFLRLPEGPIELSSTTLLPGTALAEGAWSRGGIGAPSVATFREREGEAPRYQLLVDASNLPRSNEELSPFAFSIGGAFSSGVLSWVPLTVDLETVLLGGCPPACAMGVAGCGPDGPMCEPLPSTREPSILAMTEGSGVLPSAANLELAYARARGTDIDGLAVYDLYTSFMTSDGRVPAPPSAPTLTPEQVGGADHCASLRDPVLLPRSRDPRYGFWMLFTCERAGLPNEIWAHALGSGLTLDGGPRGPVLNPATLGEYAAGGVSGAEGVAFFEDSEGLSATYRVWFLARDLAGQTSVAFAQSGSIERESENFNALVPYGANPVLTPDDPILGECPEEGCRLTGLSATRRVDQGTRVRFFIARTLNRAGAPAHVLTPLEQIWPDFSGR